MHSVVHVNLHCRVASSHLHRPRANVERDVHFKKELDFLIYMRRLAAGVKPCWYPLKRDILLIRTCILPNDLTVEFINLLSLIIPSYLAYSLMNLILV